MISRPRLTLYVVSVQLWIDTGTDDGEPLGHPYAGYYLPYPDSNYEGLVTTITDVAPMLNWVYIDKDTHEAKYGVRLDAQPNLTGPFDCSRQDRRLTFDGWEGWCVVEEAPSLWALYFDVDDDGLKSKVAPGTRVLDVELSRKETRWKKDSESRQQDQTTKREVDTKEDAPVDGAITSQPTLNPPGVGVPPPEQQTDEGQGDTPAAPPARKPLTLPKSIFADPPRPLFADSELLPSNKTSSGLPMPKSIFRDAPLSPPPAYSQTAPSQAPSTTPQPSQTYDRTAGAEKTDEKVAQQQQYNEPKEQSDTPLPQKAAETTPEKTTLSEKRTTPKLNRKSGNRTMSQAQMFEALAAGRPIVDGPLQNNARPPSRPFSNSTSASDYSNPPKTSTTEIFQLYEDQESAIFPRIPIRPSILLYDDQEKQDDGGIPAAGDPAVFGSSNASSNNEQRSRLTSNDRMDGRTEPLAQGDLANNGEKLGEPFAPVKGKSQQRPPSDRVKAPYTSQEKRKSSTASRAVEKASDKRQSGSTRDANINAQRGDTGRQPMNRGASESRSRAESLSMRSRDGDVAKTSPTRPKPLSRSSTTTPRRPMTATMTSGTGNRAMATRLGSSQTPDPPRRKTSSSLIRDLDELIAESGRSRSNTASSAASGRENGKDTDRRAEDRQNPLRRGVATRGSFGDRNRVGGGRSVEENVRDAPRSRGGARRGDGGDPAVQR